MRLTKIVCVLTVCHCSSSRVRFLLFYWSWRLENDCNYIENLLLSVHAQLDATQINKQTTKTTQPQQTASQTKQVINNISLQRCFSFDCCFFLEIGWNYFPGLSLYYLLFVNNVEKGALNFWYYSCNMKGKNASFFLRTPNYISCFGTLQIHVVGTNELLFLFRLAKYKCSTETEKKRGNRWS